MYINLFFSYDKNLLTNFLTYLSALWAVLNNIRNFPIPEIRHKSHMSWCMQDLTSSNLASKAELQLSVSLQILQKDFVSDNLINSTVASWIFYFISVRYKHSLFSLRYFIKSLKFKITY